MEVAPMSAELAAEISIPKFHWPCACDRPLFGNLLNGMWIFGLIRSGTVRRASTESIKKSAASQITACGVKSTQMPKWS
jgi:hypothetical protein